MPESISNPWQMTIRSRIILALDQFAATRMQDCTIAVSTELADKLSRELSKANVIPIPNGIDVAETRLAAVGPRPLPADDRIGIGYIGRLVPVKRVDLFLQMARIIASAHPNTYRFHVVGDGPMRTSLEDYARKLELGDSCVFTGFLSEPRPLLGRLRALVLTSDHEGTPMVALEALALGVPVVAHAVGGLISLLDTERLGRLVRSQNPQLIADAVLAVVPPGSIAASSDSLLPPRFTIETCADSHMALYQELRNRHH
jgi:glycosyltransferase involved in cell wall biosynthesis